MTETNTIGFIGLQEGSSEERGFKQGLEYCDPDLELLSDYTEFEPGKGEILAQGQYEQGVDIIFTSAGEEK